MKKIINYSLKTGKIMVGALALFVLIYYGQGFLEYQKFRNTLVDGAQAAGQSCTRIDGGQINKVMKCVRDFPIPTVLAISCPTSCPLMNTYMQPLCGAMLTNAYACFTAAEAVSPGSGAATCADQIGKAVQCYGACDTHTELTLKSQQGTTFFGVTPGFVYSGGGTTPTPGMDYIGCFQSEMAQNVIGIPGGAAMRIIHLVRAYEVVTTSLGRYLNILEII